VHAPRSLLAFLCLSHKVFIGCHIFKQRKEHLNFWRKRWLWRSWVQMEANAN
jgi:hypothetical protein